MKNKAHNNQETLRLGFRLYRGLLLDSFGVKAPLFAGHKLTYNCNLKCKMCPFWKRSSENLSTQKEKEILKQIYDSGVCAIGFEGSAREQRFVCRLYQEPQRGAYGEKNTIIQISSRLQLNLTMQKEGRDL